MKETPMLATKSIAPVASAPDSVSPEKSAAYRNGMARLAAAVTIVTTVTLIVK